MQMGLVKLEAPRRDADADIWATVLEEDELFRASTDKLISGMEVIPGLGDVFTFAPNQGVGYGCTTCYVASYNGYRWLIGVIDGTHIRWTTIIGSRMLLETSNYQNWYEQLILNIDSIWSNNN